MWGRDRNWTLATWLGASLGWLMTVGDDVRCCQPEVQVVTEAAARSRDERKQLASAACWTLARKMSAT